MDNRIESNDNEPKPVCKSVRYSGQVQGVGFRYTAQRLAENFAVTGYVRNLPNGDVELVAEGSAGQVQAFLDSIAARMGTYIQQTSVRESSSVGYPDFRINH
jgi:acylphosphatase